jgi:hypothetical protein
MRARQTETGQLACRWSAVGQHVQYDPPWMQETSDIQSGYLPPAPDFASPVRSGEQPLGSNFISLTPIPNRAN